MGSRTAEGRKVRAFVEYFLHVLLDFGFYKAFNGILHR